MTVAEDDDDLIARSVDAGLPVDAEDLAMLKRRRADERRARQERVTRPGLYPIGDDHDDSYHPDDPRSDPDWLADERLESLTAEVELEMRAGQIYDTMVRERFVGGGQFVFDQPEGVPAIWGEDDKVLWSAGEALWIVGPTGVGKTTITAQVIRGRLGLGTDVLGYPVVPGERNVLYLAMDRPRQISRALRRNFTPDERSVLDERLVVWPGPPPLDLAKHTNALVDLAREANADTVIVDSVKDAAIGLSDDEVGAGFNRAVQAALVAGVEVLCLHHQRKGQGTPPRTLEDVYGSTWLVAGAGSVILLWGAAGDLLVDLVHLKQPAAEVGPLKIEHDHDAGTSSMYRGFNAMAFLRHRPLGATARDAAVARTEKSDPSENEVRKARREMEALVAKGLVHRIDAVDGGLGGSQPARYTLLTNQERCPK